MWSTFTHKNNCTTLFSWYGLWTISCEILLPELRAVPYPKHPLPHSKQESTQSVVARRNLNFPQPPADNYKAKQSLWQFFLKCLLRKKAGKCPTTPFKAHTELYDGSQEISPFHTVSYISSLTGRFVWNNFVLSLWIGSKLLLWRHCFGPASHNYMWCFWSNFGNNWFVKLFITR